MRIDLHTHSVVSDGTDTPSELMRAAAAAGLDVIALTDHDTSAGWAEAAVAADEVGIRLVPGMELSTKFRGNGHHLLAYHPDPTHPALTEELARVLGGREGRVPAMVSLLRALGIEITVEDVARETGATVAMGRPHVADALVRLGVVGHRNDAFALYLGKGRPGHIERYATPLADMVRAVRSAGGVPVLAHAWGRHGQDAITAEEIAVLAEQHGLQGLEVDHQDHTPEQRELLRGIARDLDLVVTGSSDHHGTGKTNHDLGVHTTAPEELARIDHLAELNREQPA